MKKQVVFSIGFTFFIVLSFLVIADSETYFPFEKYSLDNYTLSIFMEGTRSSYNDASIILKIGDDYTLLQKGKCNRLLDYEVCYVSSALNLSNNQGKFDSVLGLVPEVHLSIEKLVPHVSITITPDQSFYYPYDDATFTISLKNTGNIKLGEGYFYFLFDHFVQQKTFTKIKRIKTHLYGYHFYSLQPDEERVLNYTFGLYSDKNFTLTYWLATDTFMTEKQTIPITIKQPLKVTLEVSPLTVHYGDNISVMVRFEPNTNVTLETTILSSSLPFVSETSPYVFSRQPLSSQLEKNFTLQAYALNKSSVLLNGSYLKNAHHHFSLEKTINITLQKPILLLEGPLQITAEDQANFTVTLKPLASYYATTACSLQTHFTDSITTEKVNNSLFIFSIKAKPLLVKENATLIVQCNATTNHHHTIVLTTTRPIQLLPKIHEQFNTSLIHAFINQTKTLQKTQTPLPEPMKNQTGNQEEHQTTSTTTTTLVYQEKQGFFGKIIQFFKGIFS